MCRDTPETREEFTFSDSRPWWQRLATFGALTYSGSVLSASFSEAVRRAQAAMLDVWNSEAARGTRLAERDAALAAAYECRPGGASWRQVVEEVNRVLPREARCSVRTARLAWQRHRQEEGS